MASEPLTDAEIAELREHLAGDRDYWSTDITEAAERLLDEVEHLRAECADMDGTTAVLVRRLGGEAVITLDDMTLTRERVSVEVAINHEERAMRLRLIPRT